jgi:hypothetical protein
MARVPPAWHDPNRQEADVHSGNELDRLAQRFAAALDQWASGANEDESEDGDGGPETVH